MLNKEFFGFLADGREVSQYRLTNRSGAYALLLDYGATLQGLFVPDRNGILADVTVGFDTLQEHETLSAGQGKTIGRYANRIAGGSFSMDGNTYCVTKNEKDITCLHGGGEFAQALWCAQTDGENALCFTYTSPDGTMGFPGTVEASVRYTFTEDNALVIDFHAVSDKKTILNLTNHAYFNLSGAAGSDILGHILQIQAPYFTPTDENSIPTGKLRSVKGTPFDFTQAKTVGRDITAQEEQLLLCCGYDHNFCLTEGAAPAAVLYEPVSGRQMTILTDLPGVQLYTGNFLAGEPGKDGTTQCKHAGLCLETQYFPDTPNRPAFPQCTFAPGEAFISTTRFCFSVQ